MHFNDYRILGFTTLPNPLIAYYTQIGLTDNELLLVVQLEAFAQRGDFLPASEKIAGNTNLTTLEIDGLLQNLIDKKFIVIKKKRDKNNKIANFYSLAGLYDKLDDFLQERVVIKKDNHDNEVSDHLDNNPLNKLYREFEIEFGRFLSPIEKEQIASWLTEDHYQPEHIELALREAVLAQAYSIKYVDRVLLNWQRHNLRTSDEIKHFLQRNR